MNALKSRLTLVNNGETRLCNVLKNIKATRLPYKHSCTKVGNHVLLKQCQFSK